MKIKLYFVAMLLLPGFASGAISCRNPSVKHQFDVEQGYPKGRKGYVVDHICALACGGIDSPVNMQYQTKEQSIRKDKWERTPEGCASTCWPFNSTPTRQVFNCKKPRNSDDR